VAGEGAGIAGKVGIKNNIPLVGGGVVGGVLAPLLGARSALAYIAPTYSETALCMASASLRVHGPRLPLASE